jgi:hypothetical protein
MDADDACEADGSGAPPPPAARERLDMLWNEWLGMRRAAKGRRTMIALRNDTDGTLTLGKIDRDRLGNRAIEPEQHDRYGAQQMCRSSPRPTWFCTATIRRRWSRPPSRRPDPATALLAAPLLGEGSGQV